MRCSMDGREHAAEPQPGAAAQAAGGAAPPTDLERELEEANRKGEEYLDLLRRARADFANFKRRTDEERADQAQNARVDVFLKILPVLDDFGRAVQNPPSEGAAGEWAQGIHLIERKLRAILEAEGLRRIEAEGAEFNPW